MDSNTTHFRTAVVLAVTFVVTMAMARTCTTRRDNMVHEVRMACIEKGGWFTRLGPNQDGSPTCLFPGDGVGGSNGQ